MEERPSSAPVVKEIPKRGARGGGRRERVNSLIAMAKVHQNIREKTGDREA